MGCMIFCRLVLVKKEPVSACSWYNETSLNWDFAVLETGIRKEGATKRKVNDERDRDGREVPATLLLRCRNWWRTRWDNQRKLFKYLFIGISAQTLHPLLSFFCEVTSFSWPKSKMASSIYHPFCDQKVVPQRMFCLFEHSVSTDLCNCLTNVKYTYRSICSWPNRLWAFLWCVPEDLWKLQGTMHRFVLT